MPQGLILTSTLVSFLSSAALSLMRICLKQLHEVIAYLLLHRAPGVSPLLQPNFLAHHKTVFHLLLQPSFLAGLIHVWLSIMTQ